MRDPRPGDLPGHIPALDGVRGLAILLVMIFHFSRYGHGLTRSDLLVDEMYYRFASAGWIGVDLFFVLSGFLITGILYDAKGSSRYFRNFYVRRALRIFPLYYGALLFFLLVLPRMRPDHRGLDLLVRDAPWYWSYLSNVKIALDGWPDFGALGHFWSLAVEEQFYLVWPVIVLMLGRRQLLYACVACIAGALITRVALNAGGNGTAAFVLTPARIDALAVGGFLAVTSRAPGGLQKVSRIAGPAATLLTASVLIVFVVRKGFFTTDPVVSTVGHTILACLFGSIVVLALTSTHEHFIARVFRSSWLGFLGRYSYGLYVFHHPILFFGAGIVPLGLLPTVFGSQLLRQFAYLLVATLVSVGLALVSWHLYEKRFLKLKVLFPYSSPAKSI
jgi:peptidoglycan/LPS O-acetylase OafA/YrhL